MAFKMRESALPRYSTLIIAHTTLLTQLGYNTTDTQRRKIQKLCRPILTLSSATAAAAVLTAILMYHSSTNDNSF
jgi:hexokinase